MNLATGIVLYRTTNDVNGNPRYVVHFLSIDKDYETACKMANKIGGRKYRGKDFGGGIVFQSYNMDELRKEILEISNTRP